MIGENGQIHSHLQFVTMYSVMKWKAIETGQRLSRPFKLNLKDTIQQAALD